MGQCLSRKAGPLFVVPILLPNGQIQSPEEEPTKPPVTVKKYSGKGIPTSFGFRKRPITTNSTTNNTKKPSTIISNSNNIDETDTNGNNENVHHREEDTQPLTANMQSPARTSNSNHRLPAPKKEAQGTKISRFGFRQTNANRLNRVADININPPVRIDCSATRDVKEIRDTRERDKIQKEIKAKVESLKQLDNNRNAKFIGTHQNVQQIVHQKVLESKNAKTVANNSKKMLNPSALTMTTTLTTATTATTQNSGDESSSFTEDSGMGSTNNVSQNSSNNNNNDKQTLLKMDHQILKRNLHVVLTGSSLNRFDLRDDKPSHFIPHSKTSASYRENFGFVQKRAEEYQKRLTDVKDKQEIHSRCTSSSLNTSNISNISNTSNTSSNNTTESFLRNNEKVAKFLKTKPKPFQIKSNPVPDPLPDPVEDPTWSGEAMAEDFQTESPKKFRPSIMLLNFMTTSDLAKNSRLLADETLSDPEMDSTTVDDSPLKDNSQDKSPVSPVSSPEELQIDEDSNSKTKKSESPNNSLSLSDERDDFLIDDEIADQPGLLCDDALNSHHSHHSEITIKGQDHEESSPLLVLRNKHLLNSRTVSLDTLSPCESIASDDCMMDYDLSSGIEDVDRTERTIICDKDYNETPTLPNQDLMRNWSALLCARRVPLKPSRLLRSREGTPTSGTPETPPAERKMGSQTSLRTICSSRSSTTTTTGTGTGYDSDDSAIRVDRARHCAMQQNVFNMKSLLWKLKGVITEPANEENLFKSDTCNSLDNGFFNGSDSDLREDERQAEEISDLKRQILFLQGQLEDKDRTIQQLMHCEGSQSAPSSIQQSNSESTMCNAATQTEKIRVVSQGPQEQDLSPGSLVSANETKSSNSSRKSRGMLPNTANGSRNSRLWRTPGDPPSPSSIPRRSCSRCRLASSST